MTVKRIQTGFYSFGFVIIKADGRFWDGEGMWVNTRSFAKHYRTLAIANQAVNDLN